MIQTHEVAAGRDGGVWEELTIAIPAYARPAELTQLLSSIGRMELLPGEVLICEDGSADRERIRAIVQTWTPLLEKRGCRLVYVENPRNLGYDGNVRKLFAEAAGEWVMLIGNDDVVLPGGAREIRAFAAANPRLPMMSGAYLKFRGDPAEIVGHYRVCERDRIYDSHNAAAGVILKLAGFLGGVVAQRTFALEASTDAYDGTLYYQMYLAALAFCGAGIGYISRPIVASRVGNSPLFGASATERAVHQPGRYSPEGRLAMWEGILRICRDVERASGVLLVEDVRKELGRRHSFHVFEFVAAQGRAASWRLTRGLLRMGMMNGVLTWGGALTSMVLGRYAVILFRSVRSGQAAWTRLVRT